MGRHSRVGTSVGHGKQTGLGVLDLEVLIGKLLAVDGAATGTLFGGKASISLCSTKRGVEARKEKKQ